MSAAYRQFAALFLASLALVSPAAAQSPPRWKLEKGQKFTLQMEQQTASLVTLSSRKLNSTVDLKVFVSWDVVDATAEAFVVEQSIDAIRLEMKGPGENAVTYDTREKKAVVGTAQTIAASVAPLIGAKFKVTLDPLGNIQAAEKIAAAAAAPATDAKPTITKESIEQLLREPFLPLPKSLEGDMASWADERQTKAALGEVKQKRTFTLAGNEDRGGVPATKISVAGNLELTSPEGKKEPVKLSTQTHGGTIWFTKEPGRLIAAESKQRLVTESMYRDSAIVVDLTTTLTTTLAPRE